MDIATRLKDSQPNVYNKLKNKDSSLKKKSHKKKANLSEKEIVELMGQNRSKYKRSKGGAMKQI